MILALKTDQPEAELYLFDQSGKQLDKLIWLAHRELSVTILNKIDEILQNNNLELKNLTGLVVFKGPGSFTGLRIGITVLNTLSYILKIPLVGQMSGNWIELGLQKLKQNPNLSIIIPSYGNVPNITSPRK